MWMLYMQAIELFVLACNCVALKVQLCCDTRESSIIITGAAAARAIFHGCFELTLRPVFMQLVWGVSLDDQQSTRKCRETVCNVCFALGALD